MDRLFQEDGFALRILNCVREHENISRSDISAIMGLSKPTVTRSVERLIQSGYLLETGLISDSFSKRKPIALSVNAEKCFCIGLLTTKSELRAVVTDFCGKPLWADRKNIYDPADGAVLLEVIMDSIQTGIRKTKLAKDQILGIGIGFPGLVDHDNGIVLNYASEYKILNLPVRDAIEKRMGIPTFVDNNVKALALGEAFLCKERSILNGVYISCWEGIGGAVIDQGKLLRGYSNTVGEIGHMIVNPNGMRCRCGKYGCVETYCSPETLCEIISESIRRGRHTSLTGFGSAAPKLPDIMAAYDQDDELCREHVQSIADYLSICLSNVINILNTEKLYLTGPLFELSEKFFRLVCELTHEKLFAGQNDRVCFERRLTTSSHFSIGGAALVLSDFYQ